MCAIDFIGSRLEIRFNSRDCGTGMEEEFYNSIFENFRVDVEFLRNSNFLSLFQENSPVDTFYLLLQLRCYRFFVEL